MALASVATVRVAYLFGSQLDRVRVRADSDLDVGVVHAPGRGPQSVPASPGAPPSVGPPHHAAKSVAELVTHAA